MFRSSTILRDLVQSPAKVLCTTNSTHAISRHAATSPQIYNDVILLKVLKEV